MVTRRTLLLPLLAMAVAAMRGANDDGDDDDPISNTTTNKPTTAILTELFNTYDAAGFPRPAPVKLTVTITLHHVFDVDIVSIGVSLAVAQPVT